MHGLAFRKFLDLDTKFTYFTGNLPIGKERRYFIRKGKVQCHHHYWVQEAFDQRYMIAQDYTSTQYNKLMRILAKLNKEDPEEITLLTKYAQQIADIMPEYYSVDFAMDKTGKWWMIDMAKGSLSWHPKCIYADPNE